MTANDNIAIVYCAENKEVAFELNDFLQSRGVDTTLLSEKDLPNEATFATLIGLDTSTIIIYTDNFFKSKDCMSDGLLLLQELRSSLDFLPIIADGSINKVDGTVEFIPTEFKRVSNVIHHMNFWQDQYLELRKQKRNVPKSEEEEFAKKIDQIKSISGETGEFLRLLRDTNFAEYSELKSNNFAGLVRRLGLPNTPEKENTTIPLTTPTPPSIEEIKVTQAFSEDHVPDGTPQPDITPDNESFIPKEIPLVDLDDLSVPEYRSDSELDNPNDEFGINHQLDAVDTSEIVGTPNGINHKEEAPVEDFIESDIEQEASDNGLDVEDAPTSDFDLTAILEDDLDTPSMEEPNPELHQIIPSKINDIEKVEDLFLDDEEIIEETNEDIVINLDLAANDLPQEEEELEHPIIEKKSKRLPTEDFLLIQKAEQAKNLIAEGAVQEGAAIYKEILAAQPNNTAIRYKYAKVLAKRLHHYELATNELSKILDLDDRHADAYHLLAEIAQSHKDFILAKNYYEKTLNIDPAYPKAHYKIGRILASQFPDQKDLAAKYFKQQIKLNGRHVDSHYQYGVLLNEHLGKYSKAINHFKKTLKLNPLHPFAAYDLALLYHKLYEPNKATNYYQKAIKNNPELKTPQNEAVFLKLSMNEVSRMSPLEAFEKGLHYEETKKRVDDTNEFVAPTKPIKPTIDKTVLITGATSGIGKATAQLFAEEGYRLILTGRRADRLEQIEEELTEAFGVEINTLNFDVRNPNLVAEVINGLDKEWQNIDILINNAGLAKGYAPIHEGDLEHWETMIDTNLKGLLYVTRAVSPGMVKRKKGHIINLCSTAGIEVYPNGNVYCATKFGVDALTKAMRVDLYKHGIQVSQVSPAHVEETEFALVRFDGDQDRSKIYNDFNPLTSKDVADAIYYIATRPKHVQIRDIVLSGQQQATSTDVHRSGRIYDESSDEA